MPVNKKTHKKRTLFGMEIEDYVLTATEKEAARMEKPLNKKWFDVLWLSIIVLMTVLAVRVFYLTIVKGGYYQEVARGNSIRSLVIKAPRGRIFDKNGEVLVNNVPSIDAVIIPAEVPKDGAEGQKIAEKIGDILSMNSGEIFAKMEGSESSSLNPILLKSDISQDESLILLEKAKELPGIRIEKTAIRSYADGKIFSHILGYEGKIDKKDIQSGSDYQLTDYIGKQGIEKSYEQNLRGKNGANRVEVDSMGNMKREVGIINPVAGSDLILSIDAGLQRKLYDSMIAILEKTQTKTASAVAINPSNGEVLALVNIPSYDNNLFAKKITASEYNALIQNPDKPMFNRAITGEYPPGSTVKPGIAAGALSEGTISPSTIIDGMGGVLSVGSYNFHDWKAHGPSDVRLAIAQSNDIFFYTIGGGYGSIEGLGMSRMKKYYNQFGFGSPTGIDIGGEASGLIPDEDWKLKTVKEKWSVGNSYHAAIGQGYVTATPIQIANYIASIANGGTLYKPHLVSSIKEGNGTVDAIRPEILNKDFIAKDVMNVVREGMRETITGGTAQALKDMPVAIAGKTGTAQFGSENKTHGWFASFAPYDDPQIAMVVLIEGGGEGNSSALPVTKDVYSWYFGGRK